jgi:hypothetical protein
MKLNVMHEFDDGWYWAFDTRRKKWVIVPVAQIAVLAK